ncbi:hypothetical protein LINPERPRIM_LOCUS1435 [Linum perenne]
MLEDAEINPSCPKVSFSEDELRLFFRPWSKALVVKVLEKTFSFGAVKRRLETLWAKNGSIQVSDIANSFFLVRFANPDDYHHAAFNGPWKIYDYYFSVGRWTPEFNEEEPIRTVLTWVRLPKLPIHFFNQLAITRIGNCIGRTVKLDLATAEGARARYARVCVEVDLSKPLLGKYMIENRTFFVEYESLENICASCGFYGHKSGGCVLSQATVDTAKPVGEMESKDPDKGDVGDWMVVQRRSKGRSQKTPQPKLDKAQYGSRFEALSELDDEVDEEILVDEIPTPPPSRMTASDPAVLAANLAAALSKATHLQDNLSTSRAGNRSVRSKTDQNRLTNG